MRSENAYINARSHADPAAALRVVLIIVVDRCEVQIVDVDFGDVADEDTAAWRNADGDGLLRFILY